MSLALGWIALGLAIAIGSYRMDRLEQMHIEPWSAPGLVPGLLGVLIALFGAQLALREVRARRAPPAPVSRDEAGDGDGDSDGDVPQQGELRRVAPVLALCVAFVVGALGRGLPFIVTSSVLVVAWISLLRWRQWRDDDAVARGLGTAVVIAVVSCTVIAVLFEDVFLVRLP